MISHLLVHFILLGSLSTVQKYIFKVIYERKRVPILLFGNKLDLCPKGEGR